MPTITVHQTLRWFNSGEGKRSRDGGVFACMLGGEDGRTLYLRVASL